MTIKAIVTDIEGTTSSISFVKDVLFPYARENMEAFVKKNEKKIAPYLDEIRKLESKPDLTTDAIINILTRMIDADSKATPLKALQGMIWESGYKAGHFQGHIYDDALEKLRDWHSDGIELYVYSSGSIPAQRLLFGHTPYGNLTSIFSGFFDTTTGPKMEAESYRRIITQIGHQPQNTLFLSDAPKEIDAANQAGMHTILVSRDVAPDSNFMTVRNFHEIALQEKAA